MQNEVQDTLATRRPSGRLVGTGADCRLCLGPHDKETHEATEGVHVWLKSRIALYLSVMPMQELIATKKPTATTKLSPPQPKQPRAGVAGGRPALPDVTIEKILARRREGATLHVIAAELKCSTALLMKKIRKARRTAEYREEEAAARTCPIENCGRPKWPSRAVCNRCASAARKSSVPIQ